jgi:hypothetical protein
MYFMPMCLFTDLCVCRFLHMSGGGGREEESEGGGESTEGNGERAGVLGVQILHLPQRGLVVQKL